jgi:hypothetical protein
MTSDQLSKSVVPWRQLAAASIIEAAQQDHAAVIALMLMQE